jgi:hypothetical protein
MPVPIDYTPSFVAFLDVLGWKDAVNHSVGNADLRAKMAEAIEESNMPDGFPGAIPQGFPRGSQFSDSIVLSRSMVGETGPHCEDSFFGKLSHFCIRMLLNGFFVRGGMTSGLMFHRGHVAFGPALVEAIEIEKAAKYPRVVMPPGWDSHAVRVRVSEDGIAHLDILRMLMVRPENQPAFDRIRQVIEEKLQLHPVGSNPSIRNKYIWFARYFNEVAAELHVGQIIGDLKWAPEKSLWGRLKSLVCRLWAAMHSRG